MIRTSRERLHVFYDGPALACNEMDVRMLAPALYAFSDLLKHANQALNGERAEIEVRVRASFKSGSFGIEFNTLMSLFEAGKALFGNENITTAKEILEWLGLLWDTAEKGVVLSSGLIGLLLWLKGKTPNKIEPINDKESKIQMGKQEIVVRHEVIVLMQDPKVRKALRDICHPLNERGIDALELSDDSCKNRKTIVKKSDVLFLELPNEEEVIEEEEYITSVQIVRVDFKSKKWQFSFDDDNKFNALVLDEDFLNKVKTGGVSFTNGDWYKVRLCKKLFFRQGVIKADYSVLKVIEHFSIPRNKSFKGEQGILPFDED